MTSAVRFVRQFALTGGRAPGDSELAIECTVVATPRAASFDDLAPEQQAIVDLARVPLSVAEIGAYRGLHIGIVRVLVGDLVRESYLEIVSQSLDPGGPDLSLLDRLIEGIRQL